MSGLLYLQEGVKVHFELVGALPILREQYLSPQAGKTVLKGFFNQTAHLELLDGSRFRTLAPRRDEESLDQLAYPLVRLPEKVQVCRLLTPLRTEPSRHLQFSTTVEDRQYIYKPVSPGKRGFEIWDSTATVKIVSRIPGQALVSELTVLQPVPAVLVLLVPWLDNQTLPLKSS